MTARPHPFMPDFMFIWPGPSILAIQGPKLAENVSLLILLRSGSRAFQWFGSVNWISKYERHQRKEAAATMVHRWCHMAHGVTWCTTSASSGCQPGHEQSHSTKPHSCLVQDPVFQQYHIHYPTEHLLNEDTLHFWVISQTQTISYIFCQNCLLFHTVLESLRTNTEQDSLFILLLFPWKEINLKLSI